MTASARPSGNRRGALRRHFRSLRQSLDRETHAAHARAVARRFFTSGLALSGRSVGLYMASDGEVDLGELLDRLLDTRKRVLLPVVHDGGRMTFYRIRRRTPLSINRYGIIEPAPGAAYVAPLGIDVLLMPLVAFDGDGNRLGRGAGFYDRYLGRLPPALRPRLIGVAHEVQRSSEPLPADAWDVPLDGVLTESGLQRFTSR